MFLGENLGSIVIGDMTSGDKLCKNLILKVLGDGIDVDSCKGGGGELSTGIECPVGEKSVQVWIKVKIQPTIEITPGLRFNVFVTKDVVLEPYEE